MIQQAGLLTFIRTILIIVAVFYGIKLIFRFLLPYLLRYLVKKQQSKFREKGGDNRENFEDDQNKKQSKSTKPKENLGEYVDFEEIDD